MSKRKYFQPFPNPTIDKVAPPGPLPPQPIIRPSIETPLTINKDRLPDLTELQKSWLTFLPYLKLPPPTIPTTTTTTTTLPSTPASKSSNLRIISREINVSRRRGTRRRTKRPVSAEEITTSVIF